jgi:predicted lactoylglutathione lyase
MARGDEFRCTLPVRDVRRSKAFFAQLGFGFDPRLPDDETAACMPVGGKGPSPCC